MSFTKLPGYYEVFPVSNGKEYSWKLIKSSAEKNLTQESISVNHQKLVIKLLSIISFVNNRE